MTSDGFHTYTYDAEGNIAAVDNGGTVSYVYDAMNRKVHAQFPSSTAEYLYDVSNRITTVWPSPTFSNESHQFWDGRQLTLRSGDGRTYFVHTDAVMTDRVHSDPNGDAAATFTSLPFGDEGHVSDSDSYATWDFSRFGDQDWDSESNTDRALFRQYSPTQGRWLSPDPYSGSYDPTNPQSFNRYAYVLSNPLSYIDPTGLAYCYIVSFEWSVGASRQNPHGDEGTQTYLECIDTPGGGNGGGVGGGRGGGTGPNVVDPKVVKCASQALKKNGVSLTLDVAGVGAGFLPGGDLVVAGAQMGIGAASTVNSAVSGDAPGAVTSIFGFQLSAMAPAAKWAGVGAKAVPVLGAILSAAGGLNDAGHTYQDYQSCMAGH